MGIVGGVPHPECSVNVLYLFLIHLFGGGGRWKRRDWPKAHLILNFLVMLLYYGPDCNGSFLSNWLFSPNVSFHNSTWKLQCGCKVSLHVS